MEHCLYKKDNIWDIAELVDEIWPNIGWDLAE